MCLQTMFFFMVNHYKRSRTGFIYELPTRDEQSFSVYDIYINRATKAIGTKIINADIETMKSFENLEILILFYF